MSSPIKPKSENADKGFTYTVTPEQIEAYKIERETSMDMEHQSVAL